MRRGNASPSSRAASPSSKTIIPSAEVIDPPGCPATRCKFGAHVTVVDEETEDEKTYRIVGVYEADMKVGSHLDLLAARQGADRQEGGRQRRGPAPAAPASMRSLAVRFAEPPMRLRMRMPWPELAARHDRRSPISGPRRSADRGPRAADADASAATASPARPAPRSSSSSTTCRPPAPSRNAARPTASPC